MTASEAGHHLSAISGRKPSNHAPDQAPCAQGAVCTMYKIRPILQWVGFSRWDLGGAGRFQDYRWKNFSRPSMEVRYNRTNDKRRNSKGRTAAHDVQSG
ncbi:hypothetical protein H0178_34165 [Cytobacillus firmus]|nr:hypothetical protein [Cytobacillus firmus]